MDADVGTGVVVTGEVGLSTLAPCVLGGRAAAMASPGDIQELLFPLHASSAPDLRKLAGTMPHVRAVAGVTWRGHNPAVYKINQDRMVVAYDMATASLLLCVFDGHGQHGHKVSEFMKHNFPLRLFADRRYEAAPCDAMAEILVETETSLLRGACGCMCASVRSTSRLSSHVWPSRH